MKFNTLGNKSNPAVLFFHAMGVTGESSIPVAEYLKDSYYCIMPTATVYCQDQEYKSKEDEVRQVETFLKKQGIHHLTLVVASSLGADLATYFLSQTKLPVDHVFFDGGQFAQIPSALRCIMTPFLYLAIRSFYWTNAKSLKHILWCDDEAIRPYFIAAGKNLRYKNLRRQLRDSVKNEPFPMLPKELQEHTFWEFGTIEDHFKYRNNVIQRYKYGNFPVFKNYNHMQFQIRDPEGFAEMLLSVIKNNRLTDQPFIA